MAEQWYQLPDGSSVAIDENATDEELRNLFEQLAGEFPSSIGQAWNIRNSPFAQEEQEKGGNIFGSLLQGIENIPRGLAGIPVMAAQAAAAYATPFADTDLEKRLRKAEDWINKGIDPKYADANLSKLGLAMGQVGGFALAGLGAAYTGLGAGVPALLATRGVPAVAARMLTPAVIGAGGLGAAVNTSQQARMIANYEERTGEDVSAFRELAGLAGASALGVTEAVPLFGMAGTSGILGRAIQQNTIKQAAAKTLTKQNIYSGALRGALTEAAQESGVEIGQSALARALYDDEAMENLAEDVFDAGIIGGEAGALTSILANLASRSLAKRSSFGRDLEIENILRRRARNMQTGAYGPEAESQPESGIIPSMRARIRGVSPLQRLGPGAAPTALLTEGTVFGNFAELSPEDQEQRRQRRTDLHLEAVQSEQAAIQGSLPMSLTRSFESLFAQAKEDLLGRPGNQQLEDAESLMGEHRRVFGGGELSYLLEHVGDLPNRLSPWAGGSFIDDYSALEKINRALGLLTKPYGMPEQAWKAGPTNPEYQQWMRSGSGFAKDLEENISGIGPGSNLRSPEVLEEAAELRRQYAEAHRQLPASNQVQQLAKAAPIAIAEGRYGDAISALEQLKGILEAKGGYDAAFELYPEEALRLEADINWQLRHGGTMDMVGGKQPLTEEEQLAEASRRAQEDIDEDIGRWEENQRFEAEVGASVGIPFVELSQWSSTSIEDLVGMASEGTISPQVLAGIVASDRISKAGNTERNALRQFIIRSATPNLSYDSGAVASAIMRNIPRVIKDDAIREVYSDPSLSQQEKRSMIMEFSADYLSLNGQIDAADLLKSRASLAPSEVNQIVRAAQESAAQGNRMLNQIYGLVGGADLLERVTELETGQMPFNFQTPSDESQVEVLRRATEEKVWDNASAFQSFIENDILAPRNIFLNKSKQLGAVGRNSDAFRNMLFAITGESRLSDMTPGQRKSVLGHLSNLPVFPEPSYMPDITQRTYDPADLMSVIVGLAEARDSGRTSFASASKIQQMLGGLDEDPDVLRVDIATVRQMMRDMIDAGYVETNAELGSGKVSAIALKPDSRPLNQAESIDTEAAETDAERYQMEQEEIDNIKTSEEFARRTTNHYEFMRTWMDNNGLSPIALELAADSESLYAAHVNLLTDPSNADRAFAYLDRPNAKIVVDLSRVDPEGTRSSDEIVREVLSEEAWTAFWEFDYLDQAAKDTMRRYARNNVVFEKTDESANRRGLTFVDLVKERRPQLNEMDVQEKAAIISMMSIIRGEAPASKAVGKVGSIKSRIVDIAKASVNAARDSDIAPMLAIYTQFEKGMLGRRGPGLSAISDESAPVRSLYYTEYADPEHLELLRQAIADEDQQAQEQIADDILNEKVNLRRAANEPTPPSFIDKLINRLNAQRAVDETHVSGVPPFSPDASDEALDEVARIQRGEAPYTMPAAIKEKFRRKDMWAPTPRHRELLNSFLEEDPVDPGKKSRLSAVERFILEGDNDKTLEDTTKRFTEIANDFRYKFRYIMLQRSLPTEIQQRIKTSATGQRDMADVAAIAMQHFRDNTRNFMANAMSHGPPVWMGEGPTNGMLESTLNLNMDGRPIVGMLEMFSNLGPESEKAAIAYLTAQRYTTRNAMKKDAQEILDEDDKSNNQLLTPTDRRFFEHQVKDLDWEWSKGKPITDKDAREIIVNTEMGAPHVRKFFQQYKDFNKILIRSAQGMGIISQSMAEWHLKQDFVPFYTKVDPAEKWPFGSKSRPTDTTKRHPFVFMRPVLDSKNLINIDLFGNIMDNVEGVIRDGLTNATAVRTQRDAELLTEQGLGVFTEEVDEQGADTITIYKNGEASFHRMADPLLAHSQMLIGVPITNQLIDLMRVPGYVLRETVVRTPVFMGTNMLKDSQAAYLHFGGEGFIPILSSMDQAFDPTMLERAQRVGVASSIDFVYNPSGPSLSTPGIAGKYLGFIPGINIPTPLERRMRAYKPESILDYAAASWYGLGRIGDRAEAATRMAVYDRVLAATGNRAEAAYQALEIMNYGRRGADPLWNTIMSMVPFMNGMIQGEDVLYRSLTGQEDAPGAMLSGKDVATRRMKAFNRGLHMAAASLIYYMLIRDDDAYKMASEDRKMNNYIIPLGGGKVLYMPIGFTAGTLFKVLPETFARALMEEDYDLTDVGKEWWKQANTTLDIHIMPQAVRPLWNAMRNYDEYRREPIVPAYMADMPGEFQRTDYTSNSAAAIGKLFGVLPGGEALGLSSPMKIEYLWRQYFGTMGLYAMLTSDRLIRQVTGENVVGTRYDWGVKSLVGGHGIENMPMLGDRLDDISTGTGMVNVYYDLEDRIDTAVTLMNKMKEKGDSEGLRKFVEDNRALLRYKSQIRSLGRYLDSWRERRDRLLRSNIDDDRKREMMDRLNEQRAKRLSQVTDIGAGIRSA
tara:strand:- start:105 stop:7382 length:7278 start_codon:yes stop_codon:yes gene_type:complete